MKKYLLILALLAIPSAAFSAPLEPGESCYINFGFSPRTVEQGDKYYGTISSGDVKSGSLEFKCSKMTDWSPLSDNYLNYTFDWLASDIGTNTCQVRALSQDNLTCSDGDTVTIVPPSCSASLSWSSESVAYGGSATESWNMTGADQITGECTGVSERDLGSSFSGNYTFNNLKTDTTCTIKGYDNGVLACSASATVKVNPPPPPPTPLKINVNAPSGMSWKVVGPQTFTGTGNEELEAPAGTYTLYVTNGWKDKVVTSISPAQQQSLEAPPAPGVPTPTPPPPPPPTLTPTNPVEPDPDRPKPIEPVGPFDRMFFKSSPVRFLSYFLKSVNATEGSITFTVNTRSAKNPSGSLNVSSPTLTVGQSYSVTGTTNDPGNAFKYLNLFKKFTRLSNGQTGTAESTSWNAISTDQNGNFTHSSVFGCSGGDSSTFLDSDYSDQSYVVYDQGDGTGDTSPVVSMNKLCGLPFSIISKNQGGAEVPISWNISGMYANWDNTDSQYTNGLYSIRLDRGLNSFSAQMPPGYGSFKADLWLIAGGRGGGRQLRGTYNSFSIPFDLNTAGLQLEITWIEGLGPNPKGEQAVCLPASQEVEIGKEAILYGEGGISYSWNAPGGSPSSGSGDSFKTTYNSIGSKTVTVSSGGKPGSCTVNVSDPTVTPPPPIPTVDLKINNFDSWTMNSGESATLSWTSTNADSCVASGGSPGWSSGSRPVSGSWNTGNLNIPPNSYAYTIRCFNESGDNEDTAILTLIPPGEPTLNVNLNAVPAAGQSPLNSSLTATVSGTATGNIGYYFWWNCSSSANTKAGVMADGCGDPSNPLFGQVVASTNENPKTIPHSYVGVIGATFTPKVVVERGAAASAQDKTNIVIRDDGNSHLTCVNNSCVRVPGAGANTCAPEGSTCVSGPGGQTHLECINNSCVSVPGAGSNNCSPVGAVCSSEPPIDPESACTFTSSPKLINRGGSSRLGWDCDSSVNSCSISPSVPFPVTLPSGGGTVSPQQTTRYTLTCNVGGEPTSWNASVNVFQVDEDVPQ